MRWCSPPIANLTEPSAQRVTAAHFLVAVPAVGQDSAHHNNHRCKLSCLFHDFIFHFLRHDSGPTKGAQASPAGLVPPNARRIETMPARQRDAISLERIQANCTKVFGSPLTFHGIIHFGKLLCLLSFVYSKNIPFFFAKKHILFKFSTSSFDLSYSSRASSSPHPRRFFETR